MRYIVKTPILRNDKYYEAGSEIELDQASAGQLTHAISPIGPPVFAEKTTFAPQPPSDTQGAVTRESQPLNPKGKK